MAPDDLSSTGPVYRLHPPKPNTRAPSKAAVGGRAPGGSGCPPRLTRVHGVPASAASERLPDDAGAASRDAQAPPVSARQAATASTPRARNLSPGLEANIEANAADDGGLDVLCQRYWSKP